MIAQTWKMWGLAAVASCLAISVTPVRAQSSGAAPQVIELRSADGDVLLQLGGATQYWVGIFARPADDALRAQLKLKADEGLLVDEVAADSPALKAGIQKHDLLLAIGDTRLTSPLELIHGVAAANGKPVTFELLRAGERMRVEVTPDRRPQQQPTIAFRMPQANVDHLRTWMKRLDDPARGPIHLRSFGPGVMLGTREIPKLPEGVSVQIRRTGAEPAHVVVTRGEQRWELSDKPEDLSKLPEDLRGPVSAMLGNSGEPFHIRLPHPTGEQAAAGEQPGPPMNERLERRLDQVEQRLDEIMRELRQK